jgi:outer membrane lipoprotein-sorting protein
MRRFVSFLLTAAILLLPIEASAQQAKQPSPTALVRDQQAVLLLTHALNAAGGSSISLVQDFTGTGNITYYWAGKEVTGTATVRGLGVTQFRLDAQLPEGPRSWVATDIQGTIKETDGKTKPIQYSNTVNLGSLTFPYTPMAAALSNSTTSISLAGTANVNGRQATLIRVQQTFSAKEDPTGDEAKLNTKNYAIDPQTFAVLETQDTMWSDDGRMRPITHEVIFSDFAIVNGLKVPLSIVEKLGGQQTWSLQLNSVTFNTGLDATLFKF